MLQREMAAAQREAELLARENAVEKERNRQFEASSAELRELVRVRLSGPQGAGQGVS